MNYHFDDAQHTLSSDEPIGPAGSTTATIGLGIVARIDVISGSVVSLRSIAPAHADAAMAVMHRLVAASDSLDAIRRLVLATDYSCDDSADRQHWWALDRLHARLQLEREHPELTVSFDDRDFDVVVDALEQDRYVRTTNNDELLSAALEAFFDKTNRPSREVMSARPPRPTSPSAGELGAGEPVVVLDSHGADLSNARRGGSPSLDWRDGVLTIGIPILDAERWAAELDVYLIEPDHDDPVLGISQPQASGNEILARFTRSNRADWSTLEVVAVPRTQVPELNARTTLGIAQAEVWVRTAWRLAQLHENAEAARKRLGWARDAYKGRQVPQYFHDRLDDIERAIKNGTADSGLLGDR